MKVDYIEHYGTDLSVVNAARVSFDNESDWELDKLIHSGKDGNTWSYKLSDKDTKLVHYLAKHKHTSCFEHQGATLRLKVPIFIARQIQRHRTFSYNEISRRYVDSAPEFFWPDKWRKRADNVKQGSSDDAVEEFVVGNPTPEYEERFGKVPPTKTQDLAQTVVDYAMMQYTRLLEGGVAPELARMILPQNMYTEFYMTGNLRNWAHFLKLRLDGHAQKEVQDVAKMVEEILRPLFPVSVEALMQYD